MNILTKLADKHFSDKGSHKHNYTKVYDKYLSDFENKEIKLLEIGFAEGGSCSMWLDYFKNAQIFGADFYSKEDLKQYHLKNPYMENLTLSKKNLIERMENVYKNERFTFIQLDQSSRSDLLSLKYNFDVIIDDGSHIHGDIQQTLGILCRKLNKGGYYFIEDLNCKRSINNPGRSKESLKKFFNLKLLSKIYARDTRDLLTDLREKNILKSGFITKQDSKFITDNFILESMESITSGTIACLKRIS